ncbi:MAG TPA: NAD(P)-dependent alcohol dehydrogenase [Streptosporangiaceae bacterium]|jgi:NADPH:quinone reductase-like Zn-dependent oxidoreductase|nr:NAD(P)-dependent alcohol dehydrogenase [Streptosporangiaceae bacterium]
MKAYVQHRYGPPDRLELAGIPAPVPAAGEVLVRVRATSVNPYDWHLLRGEPRVARLMPGLVSLRAPKFPVPGCDLAGQVEATGPGVTQFRPGDDVFALVTHGCYAEYVTVPETMLARMPGSLSFEQAAAVPMAALTALIGLRDTGRVESGQQVLVNGASGGVGTFAVQLARAFGARADAVCRAANAELVRSIGADEVTDRGTADFTRCGKRYDLLLDIAGTRQVRACRRVLTPTGTMVLVGGPAGRWLQPAGHVFAAMAMSPLVRQRVALAQTVIGPDRQEDLRTLAKLIDDGRLSPVIGARYPFAELPQAITDQESGRIPGKVVITL